MTDKDPYPAEMDGRHVGVVLPEDLSRRHVVDPELVGPGALGGSPAQRQPLAVLAEVALVVEGELFFVELGGWVASAVPGPEPEAAEQDPGLVDVSQHTEAEDLVPVAELGEHLGLGGQGEGNRGDHGGYTGDEARVVRLFSRWRWSTDRPPDGWRVVSERRGVEKEGAGL